MLLVDQHLVPSLSGPVPRPQRRKVFVGEDIFAVHPKWLERHMRHFGDALYHLERGDGMAACYNAYVSVEALLKGVLGYSPYGDLHKVGRLPSLLKRAIGASSPDVEECAECLERKAFSEEGGSLCKMRRARHQRYLPSVEKLLQPVP